MRQSLTFARRHQPDRCRHQSPEGEHQDRLVPVQALDERTVEAEAEAAGEENPVADVDLEIDQACWIAPEDDPERADHAEEESDQPMKA